MLGPAGRGFGALEVRQWCGASIEKGKYVSQPSGESDQPSLFNMPTSWISKGKKDKTKIENKEK
jgi:hypothetical protein